MPRMGMLVCSLVTLLAATPAGAQTAAAPPVATQALDPDLRPAPAEPDFTLGALPTTLRVPAGKGVFRMTHRFARPIAAGSAGDFFSDFFGFDSAARIGIEVRYGIRPGLQAAIHRTNDRTIQMTGQIEFLAETDRLPFAAQGLLAIEGRNNFGLSDEIAIPGAKVFSTTLGAVLSHRVRDRAALYVEPLLVLNSNIDPARAGEADYTAMIGFGGRFRLGASRAYVFAEVVPRVAGFKPGHEHVSFGIEKRMGGHVFQFNISNALGTTMGQLARGGPETNDWFIGFNLSRKFY